MTDKTKKTVVLGASPNSDRFSHKAVKSMIRHHIPVIPVGIKKGHIKDIEIKTGMPHLEDIDTITLYIGAKRQPQYYDYILSLKPRRIIFNPGTENDELMEMARGKGIETIIDCTLIMVNSDEY